MIECHRVIEIKHLGDKCLEKSQVILFVLRVSVNAPVLPHRLYLVVAAPHRKGGVISEPLYIVDYLLLHICAEFHISTVHSAGKHKVLPYQQSKPVAGIIEAVIGIRSAAPHSYHIEIRHCTLL